MRGIFGGPLQGGHHHRLDLLVGDGAWSSRARLIDQAVQPAFDKPSAPHPHRLRPYTDFSSNLCVGFACRATQYHPTSLCQRLRRRRPSRPPHQRRPLVLGQHQLRLRPAPIRHEPSLRLFIGFLAQDTSWAMQRAQFGHHRCQRRPIPLNGRWFEAVLGGRPILASVSNLQLARLDVCAPGELTAYLHESCPCFLLGCVPLPQLFSFSVDDAGTYRELAASGGFSTRAAPHLDSTALWAELATLSHRDHRPREPHW